MKISGNLSRASGGAGLPGRAATPVAPAAGESVLERGYPGVVRAVTMMWGHSELTDFLERVALGLDERLRDIDPAAMAELMLLASIHRSFCPSRKTHFGDSHPALRGAGGWALATQRR